MPRRCERLLLRTLQHKERFLNHPEIIKLQKYLQIKFNNRAIDVRPRKQNDSVEVYLGEEFLGLIYVDDEDGDKSYNFQMAILEEDLADVQ
jgi:Protein of unknown function (DUF3126)